MQKTTILIFSFLLLCFSNAFAQEEEFGMIDIKAKVQGPVKQLVFARDRYIQIKQYDNKGRIVSQEIYEDGTLSYGIIWQYEKKNECQLYYYDPNRRIYDGERRTYQYDKIKNIAIKSHYYSTGELHYRDSIVYNAHGSVVEDYYSLQDDSFKLKYACKYDTLNRLVRKYDCFKEKGMYFKYMSNGNFKVKYSLKNKDTHNRTYILNSEGQVTKIEDGEENTVRFSEYDQYNNWQKADFARQRGYARITWNSVRQIDYYSQEEKDSVYLSAEQKPEFPGGQKAMFQYIADNAVCPLSASKNGFQGRAICQFVVNKSGDLADIMVVRSSGNKDIDNEAVRVITTMPKWTPGRSQGEIVRSKYTIPVTFKIAAQEPIDSALLLEGDTTVYAVVEQMPEFPGGQEAMVKFFSNNLRYPSDCQRRGKQGRVVCQFVVDKDGSISNVKVVRSGEDTSFDKEAIRVIKAMPKWKPGMLKGKPVRVKYTTPINFILE